MVGPGDRGAEQPSPPLGHTLQGGHETVLVVAVGEDGAELRDVVRALWDLGLVVVSIRELAPR